MWAVVFSALAIIFAALVSGTEYTVEATQRQVALRVGSSVPCFVDVVSAQGEIVASWVGGRNGACQIGWLQDPPLLLFYGHTTKGETIVGGDPWTGVAYELVDLTGVDGMLIRDDGRRFVLRKDNAVRDVKVPGRIVQEDPVSAEERAVEMGFETSQRRGIVHRGVVVIPNRNSMFRLLPSPDERWLAVFQRQDLFSQAHYRATPAFGDVTMLGDAQYDLHSVGVEVDGHGSVESPNGKWRAEISDKIRLVHEEGTHVTVDPLWTKWLHSDDSSETEFQLPVWNPESTAFAMRGGWLGVYGLTVISVDGTVRPVFDGGVSLVVDWTEEGMSWVSWGGGDGH